MLDKLCECFLREAVIYSSHARREMRSEPFSKISESEVRETILAGEIIKEYPEDKPHPSVLILGFTRNRRPIHVVAAYVSGEDKAIVITAYEPKPDLWYELRRRKRE